MTYPGLQAGVCGVCGNSLSIASTKGVSSYRCHLEGRPAWSRGMTHPTVRVDPFDVHLMSKLFYAVSMHAMTNTPLTALDALIPALRSTLADLVRRKDAIQATMHEPGMNLALSLKQIATLGNEIEDTERALELALSRNVAGAAVIAAVDALSGVTTTNDLPIGREPVEWRKHWSALSVADKRTLTRALLPEARLLRPADAQKGEKNSVKNRIARGSSKGFKPPGDAASRT